MKTKKITNFYLEYVTINAVPLVKTASGKYGIAADVWGKLERLVVAEIIRHKVPIRGKEVKFMRKALGLSSRVLGEMLGLSHVAIQKWEKNEGKRLDLVNEIAVRVVIATHLGIDMLIKDALLKGIEKAAKIEIQAGKVA